MINCRASRFIPACAGNAADVLLFRLCKSVHPRVCGERAPLPDPVRRTGGSSPRVRGTQRRADRDRDVIRFIPACAGNAVTAASREGMPYGSSPRVRGTLDNRAGDKRPNRFIPACAGNALRCARRQPWQPVHPRVCGERRVEQVEEDQRDGSSPRVRGTQRRRAAVIDARRFIPACAGNANSRLELNNQSAVHPRVCGERNNSSKPRPAR